MKCEPIPEREDWFIAQENPQSAHAAERKK